mmetsp:Transcript_15283/g.40475  ORF Transcript_15283/g.40475 Transcript_15283/m.40475 type:complete len:281 (-) Transcript_15283:1134-1976(-)
MTYRMSAGAPLVETESDRSSVTGPPPCIYGCRRQKGQRMATDGTDAPLVLPLPVPALHLLRQVLRDLQLLLREVVGPLLGIPQLLHLLCQAVHCLLQLSGVLLDGCDCRVPTGGERRHRTKGTLLRGRQRVALFEVARDLDPGEPTPHGHHHLRPPQPHVQRRVPPGRLLQLLLGEDEGVHVRLRPGQNDVWLVHQDVGLSPDVTLGQRPEVDPYLALLHKNHHVLPKRGLLRAEVLARHPRDDLKLRVVGQPGAGLPVRLRPPYLREDVPPGVLGNLVV